MTSDLPCCRIFTRDAPKSSNNWTCSFAPEAVKTPGLYRRLSRYGLACRLDHHPLGAGALPTLTTAANRFTGSRAEMLDVGTMGSSKLWTSRSGTCTVTLGYISQRQKPPRPENRRAGAASSAKGLAGCANIKSRSRQRAEPAKGAIAACCFHGASTIQRTDFSDEIISRK